MDARPRAASLHPEWEGFLAAIAAAPDDDLPRLVAADWLDEYAGPAGDCWVRRAELIRLQCELARAAAPAPHMVARERELLGVLSLDRVLWTLEACPELVRVRFPHMSLIGGNTTRFRRGFVEVITCLASDWLAHAPTLRARQPVREVNLRQSDALTRSEWWDMLPRLRGLERVTTEGLDQRTAAWLREHLPADVYTPPAERVLD